MNQASYEFHSPLSLLREWHEANDAPLRELLVTGYTLDLVFLERHCVAPARALGARVTVLSDAGQAGHEPVDVRHAGRAYQHGHAHCAGAFHPKLVVLLGDDHLWIAIGSGNPTMSGWGHNHELWLVLRTTREHGPVACGDLGRWLIELPAVVAVPSWIADTLSEIGHAIIPVQVDNSLSDLRIVSNLRRSVLNQLPTGPFDTVRLSAPFFDRRAAAVRALLARLQPGEVEIAVQPRLSQYSGPALVAATATVSQVAFRFLDEQRTRHGKLIEWVGGGTCTAVVGSANLSAAALLVSTATGGNCELVASYPVPDSLLPAGDPAEPATVNGRNTIPTQADDSSPGGLTLLGARRLPDAVVVELVTTIAEPITIETSPDGTPGTWQPAHVLTVHPTGITVTARFRAPEQLGGAVRAWADAGERITSTVVFLTDTQRCLPRADTADTPRLTRDYPLDEVITDPVLAARFSADLQRLIAETQSRPRAVALRSNGPVSQLSRSDDRWGQWLQQMERTLGPSLTNLLFPGALHSIDAVVPLGWTVGPEADDTELSDGETDDAVDALLADSASTTTVRLPTVPPSQRQKWRTTARRLCRATQVQPPPPLELRMLVARIYLDLLAAGIWDTDQSWRAELRDVVVTLASTPLDTEDVPGQEQSFLASLLAVCLALLLQDATLHGGGTRDLIARTAWVEARKWAAFAEPALVERYLYLPKQPYAQVASDTQVQAVIDLATEAEDDPHAELRATFEQEGLTVHLIDGVWVIDDDRRTPRRHAARVATLAGPRCAVLARNASKAAVIVRDGPTVAVAESAVPRWRIYQLSPLGTPQSLLGGDEGVPPAVTSHPLQPLPHQVQQLAAVVGANPTYLLAALLS